MNKTELISKVAEDTGLSKVGAAAAVDSFIEGDHQVPEERPGDHLRRIRHLQDRPAQSQDCAQPADRGSHQDSQAARRPLQRGQGAQDRALN